MEGATNLSDLLGSGPVQNPSLPQSTTFAPIVTGGGDPFITMGGGAQQQPAAKLYSQDATFSDSRRTVKNLLVYFAFFLGAVIISLPIPRSLFLQYIPNTYTSSGGVSYMGAGILGAIAVAIAYVLGTLLAVLI